MFLIIVLPLTLYFLTVLYRVVITTGCVYLLLFADLTSRLFGTRGSAALRFDEVWLQYAHVLHHMPSDTDARAMVSKPLRFNIPRALAV